jgi:hypothetical protein
VSLPANIYWLADSEQLKAQIQKREALAYAAWILAPAFIPDSAIERMGLDNIHRGLETFRIALRDFLCVELEQRLADLEQNPMPIVAEVRKMKPPIEMLITAQEQAATLEKNLAKLQNLPDDTVGIELIEAVMIPQLEMQLASARSYLSSIQRAMEEPDDEIQNVPMSSKPHPGEPEVPGEANKPQSFGDSIDVGNGQMLD